MRAAASWVSLYVLFALGCSSSSTTSSPPTDADTNDASGDASSSGDTTNADDGGTGGDGSNVDSTSTPPEVGPNDATPPSCGDAGTTVPALTGTPGQWAHLTLPGLADGDYCQSLVRDPVNPGLLITACGNNDGRKIKWYRTADYGETWAIVNDTDMGGNPWGFSIDPNPSRDPCTMPTLYAPAGYGSLGAWKSTDGAATWTRLTGADTAFADYNPFGAASTDFYHLAILPDDPPNHVLATYHYYFKNNTEGGFGETWDGGKTWVVHPPPVGVGTSHYVLPISATTWCVIAQSNGGTNGIWCTTTAGRTGGTAANKFRDGTIATSAWKKVSDDEHQHGSYTPVKVGSAWYSPGANASEGSIWKSTDDGATWNNLVPGYYWPSPPNPASSNKNVSGLAATEKYLYSNYFVNTPEIARAPIADDTNWQRDYAPTPTGMTGSNPLGTIATKHPSGAWLVLMTSATGVWRYIEAP